MKVKILDYKECPTEVDIDLENVGRIDLDVITGDEILTVVYKDYTIMRFDSSTDRTRDYHDFSYPVYAPNNGINLLEDQKWLNRKSSYDF